ncbi:MAG: pirin family protein, partial [Janthinobacterium lividum]
RDSVGSNQAIAPGDVNWMTAGRGIVHSERTASSLRPAGSPLFGLQCWVALPTAHEEVAPSFLHVGAGELPVEQYDGVSARIIAGNFFGRRSPVPVHSDLFYVDVIVEAGARLQIPAEYAEQALYIVSGSIDLGHDGVHDAGQMLVLGAGRALTLRNSSTGPARLMLLGGERLDGPRYLWWNFVSSSEERIEQASRDWRQQKFDRVPDDEEEFIPLPEMHGRPVRTP